MLTDEKAEPRHRHFAGGTLHRSLKPTINAAWHQPLSSSCRGFMLFRHQSRQTTYVEEIENAGADEVRRPIGIFSASSVRGRQKRSTSELRRVFP